MDSVNWRAVGQATERLKLIKNIQISKFVHEWLNVGKTKTKNHPTDI